MTVVEQRAPLKVIRAFPHGGRAALVHLHNTSGGVLSGDRLLTEAQLAANARVLLTTTSATRIYRRRQGDPPAVSSLRCQVGDDACLEYLPDLVIPFAGSASRQEVDVALAPRGRLLIWEVVAPGRTGYEALFAYDEYANDLCLTVAGVPIAKERYRLTAGNVSASSSTMRLGPWSHFASLYMLDGAVLRDDWLGYERLCQRWIQGLWQPRDGFIGVSALAAHGLVVRGVATGAEPLWRLLAALRSRLKAEIWSEVDSLPRKLY